VRAGIFISPEFDTVSCPDLVAAAGEAGFDGLIACAFNYDAHYGEFDKLGRVPVYYFHQTRVDRRENGDYIVDT